ncbi:MarR family transcriptional regulator MhqR [soil metagenome]
MSIPPATHTSLRFWIVLSRAHRAVTEILRRDMEARGLGMKEFAVLEVLFHKGPLSIGEIGSRVLLTSGSMTYVVDQLAKQGLVERREHPDDRRIVRVHLTKEGRRLIEEVFPAHAALIDRVMSELSEEERQFGADLLKRLGLSASARKMDFASTEET